MKFIFSCILCLLLWAGQEAACQAWFTADANWYYAYGTTLGPAYVHLSYRGDTVLNGLTGTAMQPVIYLVRPTGNLDTIHRKPIVFREEGSLLLFWDDFSSSYDTLFHFDTPVGGEWTSVATAGMLSMTTSVLDKGTMEVNGTPLRWMYVRYEVFADGWESPEWEMDTIVERIGPLKEFIHPWEFAYLSGGAGDLICYKSDTLGSYIRRTAGPNCEITLTAADEPQAEGQSGLHIYPNPFSDALNFEVPEGAVLDGDWVALLDANGRLLKRMPLKAANTTRWGDGLPTGLYWVRWTRDGQVIDVQRIVKMD